MTELKIAPPRTALIQKNHPLPVIKGVLGADPEEFQQRAPRNELPHLQTIHTRFNSFIDAQEKRNAAHNKTVSRERLSDMFASFVGPLALDPHILGGENLTIQEVETSARMQHRIVDETTYALSAAAPDSYLQHIYARTQALDTIFRSNWGKDTRAIRYWNGLRTELAFYQLAYENGFTVILPDPYQDAAKIPQAENEVREWDIQSGIDMILIPDDAPDYALLVDIKGRSLTQNEKGETVRRENVTVEGGELDQSALQDLKQRKQSLARVLDQHGIKRVLKTTIIVPTSSQAFALPGDMPKNPPTEKPNVPPTRKDFHKALKHATSFNYDVQNDTMAQIEALLIKAGAAVNLT